MSEGKDKLRKIFNKERFVSFLDKQGFYIVLFVCLCVIGVTAIFTSGTGKNPGLDPNGNNDMALEDQNNGTEVENQEKLPENTKNTKKTEHVKEDKKQEDDGKVDIKVKDVIEDEKAEPKEKGQADAPKETKKDEDIQKTSTKKSTPTKAYAAENSKPVSAQNKTTAAIMKMPIEGNIIKGFAIDELVYSKTLKEWSTHGGIDIEAPLGSEVKAVMAGTVESIEEDPLMGIVITLDHGNGLQSRYMNLSTKDMVKVGQNVDQGQTISGIGRTAAAEISDAPHLHFEVLKDGKNVDPNMYLK